ncbi:hypothetical protein K504DRAFT_464641 [Pleomassaria siparia CBS 279.74]|uniref:Uncharacterized protein n=1 Tax=Pleomassaria siparia CBS 279.74 TaxID=1314801 RepID=A0A6G1KJ96_9PLEO|nr:hypothetical protein K504DRAFT_464641 [Pleomassaria siparia CBS 279.74]
MRANVNARTNSSSYAKYMIEREDNPFVNKRLDYVNPQTRKVVTEIMVNSWRVRKRQSIPTANRSKYEHNRRLECRKTVEYRTRLRIARFSFRHPIYPPHNPEMAELGLTKSRYRKILSDIDDMKRDYKPSTGDLRSSCAPWLRHIRKRSTDDALTKASEYIRGVNAQDRRLVWTIEKIPGVYDSGFGRSGKEWEISVWNGEDPLELLIRLEKWGIVERRLFVDEDE